MPPLPQRTFAELEAKRLVNGRWVPFIPLRAPVDVRWVCDHRWTPHIHPNGSASFVDWDCMNCGATCEGALFPAPGLWPVRSWVAERVWWRRRRRRAAR